MCAALTQAASLKLAWEPSEGPPVWEYKIYTGFSSNSLANPISSGPHTEFTFTNLVSGSNYYFGVKAVDSRGRESDFSNILLAKPGDVAVALPCGSGTNQPPILEILPDFIGREDTELRINFTVSSLKTEPEQIRVLCRASNANLLPAASIRLLGTGTQRQLILQPALNQHGTSTLDLEVSDAECTALTVVSVRFTPVEDSPQLIVPPQLLLSAGREPQNFPVRVIDVDSLSPNLSLAVDLPPDSLLSMTNIQITRASNAWNLRISPPADRFGTGTLALVASDGITFTRKLTILQIAAPDTLPQLSDERIVTMESDQIQLAWVSQDAASTEVLLTPDGASTPTAFPVTTTVDGPQSFLLTGLVPDTLYGIQIRAVGHSGLDTNSSVIQVRTPRGPCGSPSSPLPQIHLVGDPIVAEDGLLRLEIRASSQRREPGLLALAMTWTNSALLGPDQIWLEAGENHWLLFARPSPDATGSELVTLHLEEDGCITQLPLELQVTPVDDPPSLEELTSVIVQSVDLPADIHMVASDLDTPVELLTLQIAFDPPDFPGESNQVSVIRTNKNWSLHFTEPFTQPGTGFVFLAIADLTSTNTFSLRIVVLPPPDLPQIIRPAVTAVTSDSISLEWESVHATETDIEASPVDGGPALRFTHVLKEGSLQSHQVNGLRSETDYSLRILSRGRRRMSVESVAMGIRTLRTARVYQPIGIPLARCSGSVNQDQLTFGMSALLRTSLEEGEATLTLPIYHAAVYRFWMRVLITNELSNSVWIGINENPPVECKVLGQSEGRWQWALASVMEATPEAQPVPLSQYLAPGRHQFRLLNPDLGWAVSHIIVSNDPEFIPDHSTSILGVADPSQLTDPLIRILMSQPLAWIGNPLRGVSEHGGTFVLNPGTNTVVRKHNWQSETTQDSSYDGAHWTSRPILEWRESASVSHEETNGLDIVFSGTVSTRNLPVQARAGRWRWVPNRPVEGLAPVILGVSFRPGDEITWLDTATGLTRTSRYDAGGWNPVPTLSLGESLLLDLVPRE